MTKRSRQLHWDSSSESEAVSICAPPVCVSTCLGPPVDVQPPVHPQPHLLPLPPATLLWIVPFFQCFFWVGLGCVLFWFASPCAPVGMLAGEWADGESCVIVSQVNDTSVDINQNRSPNVTGGASPCLSTSHSFYLCFSSEMKF